MALYPDPERGTTRDQTQQAVPRKGVLHFAMHGTFDAAMPQASSLHFEDGRVTLLDILNDWRLRADLVVLSACESGMGHVISGDEVMALTRGMFHAGAAAVVASLYRVRDEIAPELMEGMHRYRREDMRKAEALCQAQRDCITQGIPLRHWAPFLLYGDAG